MPRSSGGRQAKRLFHRAHALTTVAVVPEAYLLELLMAHWVTYDGANAVSGPVSLASYVERILPSIAPSVSQGLKDDWVQREAGSFDANTGDSKPPGVLRC